MFRHLSKLNIIFLILISLVLGGVARFAFQSSAASDVTIYMAVSPAGTGIVTGYGMACTGATNTTTCYASPAYSAKGSLFYTAKANPGWHFVGWEGRPSIRAGMDYTSNPFEIHLSRSWNFTAKFEADAAPTTKECDDGSVVAINANCPVDVIDLPEPDIETQPPTDPNTDNNNYDPDVSEEVVVSDNAADELGLDAGDTAEETDKEAPTVPASLSATYHEQEGSISITWDAATDNTSVSGYEVQRQEKGQATWASVGDVASEEFTDFEFGSNKTYIYQVRAYDEAKNYSAWSAGKEVVSGAFKPNVTQAEGGTVTDAKSLLVFDVPKGAVGEDLMVMINKVKIKGITLPKNSKIVGGYYDIKAKNAEGKEVKGFKRQVIVKLNYSKLNTFGITKSSLKIATSEDGNDISILPTSLDGTDATTLTDHLSYYFLVAEKNSPWVTLLWIIFWLALIAGITFGGYFGWQKYMLSRYQSEHSEDFIYKH